MSDQFVLDASAILCLLKGEAGAERVIEVMPRACISAVNLCEVVANLADAGGTAQKISLAIDVLHLRIEPFDGNAARTSGLLRPFTRALGLSLSARACLALARHQCAIAMTTDRVWADIPSELGIIVEVVR